MPDIVAIGEILVEMMGERIGQTFLEPGKFNGPFPSGSPAICIDQVARLGVSCGMIGRVGADDFGTLNLNRLKQDGVDISQISTDESRTTGIAFVCYDEAGGRRFLYHFAESAAGFLLPEMVSESFLSQAKILHISGCSLLASPHLLHSIEKAAEYARRRKITISFDPNVRPELMKGREVKDVFQRILLDSSILLTSEKEICLAAGCSSVDEAVSVLRRETKIIVLRSGTNPIRVYYGDSVEEISPFPVKEVDPTGAGDCFDGAFLAELCSGKSLRTAILTAAAAGALAVTKQGPMEGACFLPEIQRFLSYHGFSL